MTRQLLHRMWHEDEGVLSYEWVMLVTLLTIGIVGGLAAARDGIIDELGDAAQAMVALDNSFRIDFPLGFQIDGVSTGAASDSEFLDLGGSYIDCDRTSGPTQVENFSAPN